MQKKSVNSMCKSTQYTATMVFTLEYYISITYNNYINNNDVASANFTCICMLILYVFACYTLLDSKSVG